MKTKDIIKNGLIKENPTWVLVLGMCPYDSLGLFISLIVVNCIVLGRAEAFASKNNVGQSALDGLFMGLGFTWALTLIGIVRELLGTGCFFGHSLIGGADGMLMMILPPGGFLALGLLMALINHIRRKK